MQTSSDGSSAVSIQTMAQAAREAGFGPGNKVNEGWFKERFPSDGGRTGGRWRGAVTTVNDPDRRLRATPGKGKLPEPPAAPTFTSEQVAAVMRGDAATIAAIQAANTAYEKAMADWRAANEAAVAQLFLAIREHVELAQKVCNLTVVEVMEHVFPAE